MTVAQCHLKWRLDMSCAQCTTAIAAKSAGARPRLHSRCNHSPALATQSTWRGRRLRIACSQQQYRQQKYKWVVTANCDENEQADTTAGISRRQANGSMAAALVGVLGTTAAPVNSAKAYGLNKSPPPPDEFSLFGLK